MIKSRNLRSPQLTRVLYPSRFNLWVMITWITWSRCARASSNKPKRKITNETSSKTTLRITCRVRSKSCSKDSWSVILIDKASSRGSRCQKSTSWNSSITKRSSGKITRLCKNSKKGSTMNSKICGSTRSSGRTVKITNGLKDWSSSLMATKDLNFGMSKTTSKSLLISMIRITNLYEKSSSGTRTARAPSVC